MPPIPILVVSVFFFCGGIAHFAVADFFTASMPDYLSYHWELVIISGVFELLGAIGLLLPATRLWAGYGLMVLCIAVFPANINMALHPEQYPTLSETFLYLRLPLQPLLIGFIWWAIRAQRLDKKVQSSQLDRAA